MNKYERLIGHYDAETTAWSAAAGAMQTSPYRVDVDGIMTGVRILVGRTAATTLTDGFQIRLTNTSWNPNTIHVGGVGTGLQTAPAFPAPVFDWPVNQPVKKGDDITVEGRNSNASGVTNDIFVYGVFES